MLDAASSYLICCVQRTGSWLLAHTLRDTGVAGRPSDYFDGAERDTHAASWATPDFAGYLGAVRAHATTANGVFGCKMMWNDFGRFRDDLRSLHSVPMASDHQVLEATFPGLRFVWLRREDKVRQAISWWRAVVTDQWALRPGEDARRDELDVAEIIPLVKFATDCESGWRNWFVTHGLAPVEVTYEQLVTDRLATTNGVLRHLGLPQLDARSLPAVRYRQQSDDLTERYVDLVRIALNADADEAS